MRCVLGSALVLVTAVACGSNDAGSTGNAGGGGLAGSAGASADGGSLDGPPDAPLDAGPATLGPTLLSEGVGSLAEAEPHVAATAQGRVGVAWISRQATVNTIDYRLSDDGGVSFGPVLRVDPPSGMSLGDPIVAADAENNLYLAWGAVRRDAQGNRIEGRLFVAKSAADSTEFAPAVEVTDPADDALYDQPRVIARPGGGLVYSYMQYPKGPINSSAIKVAVSVDGTTFTRTVVEEGPGSRNLAFPCISTASGRVFVKYADQLAGVVLRWSDDGGQSFLTSNKTVVQAPLESIGLVTPGCAAKGDEVWVLYATSAGVGGPQDNDYLDKLRLAHSSDGGATIDWRVDAHDSAAGNLFLYPEIAGEPSGAINVAYYAGSSVGDSSGSFRYARAVNGKDFAPSTVVATPVVFDAARGSQRWLGDYVGLNWQDGSLYAAFGDNSSGTSHIAFFRSTLASP